MNNAVLFFDECEVVFRSRNLGGDRLLNRWPCTERTSYYMFQQQILFFSAVQLKPAVVSFFLSFFFFSFFLSFYLSLFLSFFICFYLSIYLSFYLYFFISLLLIEFLLNFLPSLDSSLHLFFPLLPIFSLYFSINFLSVCLQKQKGMRVSYSWRQTVRTILTKRCIEG